MSHPGAAVIIAKKRLERQDSKPDAQVELEAMKIRIEEEMFQKANVPRTH